MPRPPDSAQRHYDRQRTIVTQGAASSRSAWRRINPNDIDGSWNRIAPRVLVATASGQAAAAATGAAYVPSVLAEQSIDAAPSGSTLVRNLVGVASDGRPLESLLRQPAIRSKSLIAAGMDPEEALQRAGTLLDKIVATQIADAGRAAIGIGITSRPKIGYVRMLNTPSCSRCAILAGKFFRWNAGFDRHPLCDCIHIPTTENAGGDLRTDPFEAIAANKVTGLSRADRRAILEDGADVGQVINARRGMSAAGTTEGTTKRGFAARRRAETLGPASRSRVRPRPEQIYRQATSREQAIELLYANGYLV